MIDEKRTVDDTLTKVAMDIQAQVEFNILSQLNELISRGLLIVEKGPMIITEIPPKTNLHDFPQLQVSQSVNIKVRDQEYIMKLEKENKEMREILDRLNKINRKSE